MKTRTQLLVVLALLLVGSGGWPVLTHYRGKGRLEQYQAELRAGGEKLALAELRPREAAEGGAGAAVLQSAANRLSRVESVLKNVPPMMRFIAPGRALASWQRDPLPAAGSTNIWTGLSAEFGRQLPLLEGIHDVLRRSRVTFNQAYSEGLNLAQPHVATLRTLSEWLSAETCVALHEGQTNRAWESLAALTALVERQQQEPVLTSVLVRMETGGVAMAATWEALQSPDFGEGQWSELQRAWAAVDVMSGLEAALVTERALGGKRFAAGRRSYAAVSSGNGYGPGMSASGLNELTQLGKDALDSPKGALRNLMHRYPGYWSWKYWQSYDDELANTEAIQAGIKAIREARQQGALGPALAGFEQANRQVRQAHPDAGAWLGYSLALDGGIHSILQRAARFETERALVVAAIALKRHRLKYGGYPTQLHALAPEFVQATPRDPMDGQPLRYRHELHGSVLLYSVGENGVDDGGDPRPSDRPPCSRLWLQGRDAVWPASVSAAQAAAYLAQVADSR